MPEGMTLKKAIEILKLEKACCYEDSILDFKTSSLDLEAALQVCIEAAEHYLQSSHYLCGILLPGETREP